MSQQLVNSICYIDFSNSFLKSFLDQLLLQNKKIAMWGTGKIGQALLNALELEKTLTYLIDKDSTKHSRKLENTGLIIQAPEHLINNPVDVIIIASIEFTGDIINQIRNEFGLKALLLCSEGILGAEDNMANLISDSKECCFATNSEDKLRLQELNEKLDRLQSIFDSKQKQADLIIMGLKSENLYLKQKLAKSHL